MTDSRYSDSSSEEEEENWEYQILNNRYIIIKKIGHGSYASVWMTYDIVDSNYYAIKISNKEDYKTCFKEAQMYEIIKKYNCPYLMNIKCTFNYTVNDTVYHCKVMELMGESIYDYIKNGRIFSLDEIINITKQVLGGLKIMHDNKIIHGDIKPENILVSNYPEKLNLLINKLDLKKIIKDKSQFKNQKIQNKILESIKKIISQFDCDSNSKDNNNSDNDISDNDESDNDESSFNSDSDSESYQLSINSSEEYSDVSDDDISDDDIINDDKNINNIDNNIDNNIKNNIIPINIKITDMGGCVTETTKRKKQIQTCYYMSPEILLRLPYDETSDIWALGCTVYEMLTGKILFDPDGYDGNEDRLHLYAITKYLGPIPENMINNSRYKDIFFSADSKRIKGFKEITYGNISDDIKKYVQKRYPSSLFNEESKFNQTISYICDFISKCLLLQNRFDSSSALNHPIFSN